MENEKEAIQSEAERIIRAREEALKNDEVKGLGKVSSYGQGEQGTIMEEIGWIRIKPEELPSKGEFYPRGTEILIRAASASEIRQWSTIDDDDFMSLNDGLNHIVDKCCRVMYPKTVGNYKDLKEIDRFYIVFAIREYTFKKGENQLQITFSCNCGQNDTSPITKDMLSYYTASADLEKRFDEEERCFYLKMKTGEELKLYLPSLGIVSFITNYIREKSQSRVTYDKAFVKWAPFLFPDWRFLNEATYSQALQDSYTWSISQISILNWFTDEMQKTVKAEIVHNCTACGTEVTAPLSFRGGFKSLFLVSNPTADLL